MKRKPPSESSPTSSSDRTRHRIINAAERLFAEKGFRAMTLRDVTREANANLAAVNYHFGSKSELMRAVLRRRFEPINQERLRRLEAAKAAHAPAPIPLKEILSALIRPLFEGSDHKNGPDSRMMQIIGRAITEPAEFIRPLHEEFFAELTRRFLAELQLSKPQASEERLQYRLYLSINTMIGCIVHRVCLENISAGKLSMRNLDTLVDELVDFVVAGFQAE